VARSLGSQYYCYATIALWASAVIWRYGVIMWHILRSRGRLPVMRVDLHTNNGGLMTLTVPTHMRWEAGQHVFLRLPECDPATSHPFTIASLPNEARGTSDIENASGNNKNTMVFLVRAQQGFTARLQEKARKMAEAGQTPLFPVIIDGPYGIVPDHSEFNSVVLIAGGTGISFTLPILHGILREAANGVSICKRVELAWVVRNQGMLIVCLIPGN
jgi:predicted ferric reductase